MDYIIVHVDESNYSKFDDMVFLRVHGYERRDAEDRIPRNFATIHETLKDKNLHVYAAQVGDQFVGWISAVYLPKVGRTEGKGHLYIDELWTHPGFRRQGIGSALMVKVDALSKSIGALGLRLYVDVDNEEALSLYVRCGLKKRGQAYFMEKDSEDDDGDSLS